MSGNCVPPQNDKTKELYLTDVDNGKADVVRYHSKIVIFQQVYSIHIIP